MRQFLWFSFPSLFFLISLEVGLPSATKRASIDWFQGPYWWFHNLGTGTQKGWPPLGSARQPSQQGGLHLLAWERSSCRIKHIHPPIDLCHENNTRLPHWQRARHCALWGGSVAIENRMAHTLGLQVNYLKSERNGMKQLNQIRLSIHLFNCIMPFIGMNMKQLLFVCVCVYVCVWGCLGSRN